MREYTVTLETRVIPLGKQGENNAVRIAFDIADWIKDFGDSGVWLLLHRRNTDTDPYPAVITADEKHVYWDIGVADNAKVGYGEVELQYIVDNVLAKSMTWQTSTIVALSPPTSTPPEPYESWVDSVLEAGASAISSAETSEAYAKGTVNGEPVEEGSVGYEDNSKYYAEQAEASAERIGGMDMSATADGTHKTNPTVTVTRTETEGHYHFDLAFSGLQGESGSGGSSNFFNVDASCTTPGVWTATIADLDELKEGLTLNLYVGTCDPATSGTTTLNVNGLGAYGITLYGNGTDTDLNTSTFDANKIDEYASTLLLIFDGVEWIGTILIGTRTIDSTELAGSGYDVYPVSAEAVRSAISTINSAMSAKQDASNNTSLTTTDKTIVGAINEVDAIAKGATKALSFANISAMVSDLNGKTHSDYNVGQSIFIGTLDVPDVWISKFEASSVPYVYTTDSAFVSALKTDGYVQCGYIVVRALETEKVDLSNYYTKSEDNTLLSAKEDSANKVTSISTSSTDTEFPSAKAVNDFVTGKGYYTKPMGGIPKTDLASDVQTSLGKADTAYQKPSGGIPKTDLASAVQTSLGKADTALQSAPVSSVNGLTGAVVTKTAGSFTLSTSWQGSGPYTQMVILSGVTSNSKIDLQPDSTVITQLISDGVQAMYAENVSGIVVIYAIGAAPTASLTIQYTREELG